MRSFLHTVQKNQMLMMTPNTLGRTGVIKSFIKHTTPLRIDPKVRHVIMAGSVKLKHPEKRIGWDNEAKRCVFH